MLFLVTMETQTKAHKLYKLQNDNDETRRHVLNNMQVETFTTPNTRHALFCHLTAVFVANYLLPHCEFHSLLSLGWLWIGQYETLSHYSGHRQEVSPRLGDGLIETHNNKKKESAKADVGQKINRCQIYLFDTPASRADWRPLHTGKWKGQKLERFLIPSCQGPEGRSVNQRGVSAFWMKPKHSGTRTTHPYTHTHLCVLQYNWG